MLSRKTQVGKEAEYLVYPLEVLDCIAKEKGMTNKTKRSEEAGPPGEDTPVPGTEVANPQSKRPV